MASSDFQQVVALASAVGQCCSDWINKGWDLVFCVPYQSLVANNIENVEQYLILFQKKKA